jgi:hypothetical protein
MRIRMQFVDITVRSGYKGSRQYNAVHNLRRLEEATEPLSIRLPVEVLLPVASPGRRVRRREYKRVFSYMIECRTPDAVRHVLATLRDLAADLHQTILLPPDDPRDSVG